MRVEGIKLCKEWRLFLLLLLFVGCCPLLDPFVEMLRRDNSSSVRDATVGNCVVCDTLRANALTKRHEKSKPFAKQSLLYSLAIGGSWICFWSLDYLDLGQMGEKKETELTLLSYSKALARPKGMVVLFGTRMSCCF